MFIILEFAYIKTCDIDIYYNFFQKQKQKISKTKIDNFEISSCHLIQNKNAIIDKVIVFIKNFL